MEIIVFSLVLGPLLLLFVSIWIRQGKGRQIFIEVSGIVYFLAALYLLIWPYNALTIHLPPILWKLITLSTIVFLIIRSIRKKHYEIAVLTCTQAVILAIMEITMSPGEPDPFLQFQVYDKLLFLAGALILAVSLPIALSGLNQHFAKNQSAENQIKRSGIGIFLMMAAFTGLIAAKSMTGLFLFWQWGYLANDFFWEAFHQKDKRRERMVPVIQQSMLTLWLVVFMVIFPNIGSPAIANLSSGMGQATGLLAVLVLVTIVVMGLLIPGKRMLRSKLPLPLMGLSMNLFTLIVPFTILFKFRPLFSGLNPEFISLIVFFGSILMLGGAYYAGSSKTLAEVFPAVILWVSGWGISNVFTDIEKTYFTTGSVVVTSITLGFLFVCIMLLEYSKRIGDLELNHHLAEDSSRMTVFISVTLGLLLFAPFYAALPNLLFVKFMESYPLSMLLTAAAIALMTSALIRCLLMLQGTVKTDEKNISPQQQPLSQRILLPLFFGITVAANLLSGSFYQYLQSPPFYTSVLPMMDIEAYAGLQGVIHFLRFGEGTLYLGLSTIVLVVLFNLIIRENRKNHKTQGKSMQVFSNDSLTAWFPMGIHFDTWIKVGWIATLTLLTGVALSCLK